MKRAPAGAHSRWSATLLLVVAVLQTSASAVAIAAPPAPPAEGASASGSAGSEPPAPAAPTDDAARPAEPSAQDAARPAGSLDRLRDTHRSTPAALLMSVPCPGWGQLYADAPFWGAMAFGVQMFYLGNVLMESRRVERQRRARDLEAVDSERRQQRDLLVTEHRERARDFVWWAAAGLLLISLDAYVSVSLVDFDDPGMPVPELGPSPNEGADGAGAALSLSWRF